MQSTPRYQNELAVYRHRLGFSQKQVARLIAHKSPAMLSRYEQGHCLPPLLTALRLEIAMRIPVAYLYPNLYRPLKDEIRGQEEAMRNFGQQKLL
ncbi:MAG: helix-turn-helix transcriptional regulator [Bryobacteraceae bacterium]